MNVEQKDAFVDLPAMRRPRQVSIEHDPSGTEARIAFSLTLASGWFDGHFPGRPILPGVTQLHLAALATARLFDITSRQPGPPATAALRIVGTRRLKFQAPVLPDTPLVLELAADARPPTRVRFTLRADTLVASSGTLIVAPADSTRA